MRYKKASNDPYEQQQPSGYPQFAVPVNPQSNYHQARTVNVEPIKPTSTETGWRDLPFAILFYLNVGAVVALMVMYGIPLISEGSDDASDSSKISGNINVIAGMMVGLCGIASVLSLLLLKVAVRYASSVISFTLWFGVAMTCIMAVLALLVNIIIGIILCIFAVLSYCYARWAQTRIPFATANFKVCAAAVEQHQSLYCVAVTVVIIQMGWVILWAFASLGLGDYLDDSNTNDNTSTNNLSDQSKVAYLAMLISLYWGLQVVKNISHVTVAGTVATWWFSTDSKGATGSALKRSMTTSFGSICLGSLIVAILQALRTLAREAQQQGDALACIASCILGCIESLIEYFNRWAFVYVGVYGFNFTKAGKSVFQLFRQRGFEAIINDDLIGGVLSMICLVVGLICAGLAVGFHYAFDTTNFDSAPLFLGILGFFIGFGIALIPMSVIDSTVATIFVCFAEDPAAFQQTRPELYGPMVSAWYQLYPDIMGRTGYSM